MDLMTYSSNCGKCPKIIRLCCTSHSGHQAASQSIPLHASPWKHGCSKWNENVTSAQKKTLVYQGMIAYDIVIDYEFLDARNATCVAHFLDTCVVVVDALTPATIQFLWAPRSPIWISFAWQWGSSRPWWNLPLHLLIQYVLLHNSGRYLQRLLIKKIHYFICPYVHMHLSINTSVESSGKKGLG